MNYYEHHIGDYDSATSHLSMLEDAAYSRLMRLYYRKELPIPADTAEACRLIRAHSKDERKAVDTVLREFFNLQSDGWHQTRCDSDVERYQKKAEKNREVGKLGGRPRKTETQTEPTNNHGGYFQEPKANPLQTPDTSNQTPVTSGKTKRVAALTLEALMADELSERTAQGWIDHRKAKGAKLTQLAWDGFKAEVSKAPGWTVEAAVLKAIARNWTSFEAVWVKDEAQGRPLPESFREREVRMATERYEQAVGIRRVIPATEIIEEVPHGAPRLVGR